MVLKMLCSLLCNCSKDAHNSHCNTQIIRHLSTCKLLDRCRENSRPKATEKEIIIKIQQVKQR